ncbi:MAG: hypothetical protein JXA73_07790 [Acidobacteria bacterium]|nr:hypothetical protein [Acidobacteriota bacterium]
MPPDSTQGKYLRRCLDDFPAICRLKYGAEFDLASVEERVGHLRRSTPLTYADLKYFESPEHWWFRRYWVFPPKDHIEPALEKETFDFWNLPESNEPDTIRRLLYIFKSIELVSIILRFIRPEHYAIYSSPIQYMLDISHGRDNVETYLKYLGNMREIERRYGFVRVADVDMALWVLHEKCFGQHQDPGIAAAYSADDFMLRLRANNLVAPLAELSDARLAGALVAVKPDLAVLIACHCFEILIRRLAGLFRLPETESSAPLDQLIAALPNYGSVGPVRKALWQSLRQVRNDLFHQGRKPGPRETKLLLDEVNALESDISKEIS